MQNITSCGKCNGPTRLVATEKIANTKLESFSCIACGARVVRATVSAPPYPKHGI